ncbi:SpoIIE family protein phosphatase [Kitasatospora sp. NPDC006697]|uniref:SpoIIE family protein phosphatase n=1 Tax=Kitasatospora sp. NPDC006697 TaxID=3364020 RepID=UPI0036946A4B
MDERGGAPSGTGPSRREADGAGTAECVVDARGRVTRWSDGAQRLLGHSAGEVLGRPAARLLAEPSPAAELARAVGDAGQRWSGELALRRRDGSRVEVTALAHRDAPGCGPGTWRFVCATGGRQPRREDDDLARRAFEQLPHCSISLYDADLAYRHSNQAMLPVVGLPDEVVRGLRIQDITTQPQTVDLADGLRRAVDSGEPQHLDSFQRTGGQRRVHSWSVDFVPLKEPDGRVHGVALVAHDTTEQYYARKRLLLLNEAASRIGSTLDLAQTARELMEVTVPELADFASVDLLTALERDAELGEEALHGTVTLRRIVHRFAPGSSPRLRTVLEIGVADSYPDFTPPARALATGAGVLSNAEDAEFIQWMSRDAIRAARIREQGYHSMMAVPLRARGATLGVAAFYRRSRPDRMERFDQDDLLLAEELAARAAVAIDNARRYTRQRDTALSLQRSLLPRRMPDQSAVEVATRYLPARSQSGLGGDWFDVIPLSGARVALVVGDVVGHGIHAAATMGRLRTAVRTLADVDLSPDELLTHLDDLVIHLSAEVGTEAGRPGSEAGATCCYGVYDPVSCTLTVASAGHPPPVIALPGGTAAPLPVPVGPPLGNGGLPFEATVVELPQHSLLALYSDGLVEAGGREEEEGLARLCDLLGDADAALDGLCDTVLAELLNGRPQDDVALLLARTRALGAGRVASWTVPSDPIAVTRARRDASAQLAAWGLADLADATELIVSELVTNAIRYGAPPITLRLIHDRTLICEVSDTSSTAPHLRRARVFDEGGRGLLLVAQIADRWGTRHAPAGKTIWAEQNLVAGD